MSENILEADHLTHYFKINKKIKIKALDDVSFQIRKNEIFGIVGESGSGKSTLARCLMNIYEPSAGSIRFEGIETLDKAEFKANKKLLQTQRQIIFQDSASSLNQRMKTVDIISEPLKINHITTARKTAREEARFQLETVGLDDSFMDRYPSQMSGGQRQRVAIARALTTEPDLLIADEPVASLDVSIQAQIINLFKHLKDEHGFSILFIAHDLAMVEFLCDRVAVMYHGRIVEIADTKELYANPLHPYTKMLLSAIPIPDPAAERRRVHPDYSHMNFDTSGELVEVKTGHFVVMHPEKQMEAEPAGDLKGCTAGGNKSNMNKALYYIKKIVIFLASIFVLSISVFFMSRLTPTDPLQSYYGERTEKMSVEEKDRARERLGLNEPIILQYGRWVENALEGDFGISYKYKQDVLQIIDSRIGNTLLLGGTGFVLTFAGAILLGMLCALHEDSLLDKIISSIGTITSCIPEFWFSLVLILIFSVILHWLPSSGACSIGMESDIPDRIRHLILPLIVVVFGHLWYYAYMIRNKLLEEIRSDYVLLFKSIGVGKRRILVRHCLKNIMPTVISIMAISVPHIVGGTYIVETVFSYPGIGMLSYESARYGDYNMLMVLCMLTGVVVIFCNMIGQIINERIDPRIKANEVTEKSEVLYRG